MMDNARDLNLLVLSRHPIVALETAGEDRVEALVRSVASRLELPLFEWRSTTCVSTAPAGAPSSRAGRTCWRVTAS
jgi:hypothetical protein